jgi:hypothetical protein
MTLLGRLVPFFPFAHVLTIIWAFMRFIQQSDLPSWMILLACVYLIPPLLFRMYTLKHPIKPGRWVLNHPARCDWWIAHQLQMVYAALPALEALLRLVPGAYSAWLRLWGSKVGKRVYWTVRVEILDRHMLSIGDDVVFGHRVYCTSHIIHRKSNGDLVLLIRHTRIGKGTLIGAGARIGPGVKIPEKSVIPYNAEYRFSYAE